MSRNILVTGATGFVGSHLVQTLLQNETTDELNLYALTRKFAGDETYAYPQEWLETLKQHNTHCTVVFGDVTDYLSLKRIIIQYEIDLVYHLAARSTVSHSELDLINTLQSNIIGSAHLLQLCHALEFKLILMTTDKVYGETYDAGTNDVLKPVDLYGITKATVDQLAQFYIKSYNLPITIVRSCNIYGFDMNWSRLIPKSIKHCLQEVNPVLYINPQHHKSGLRQYIFIQDAVAFLIQLGLSEQDIFTDLENNIALFASHDIWTSEEVMEKILQYFPEQEINRKFSPSIEILGQSINADDPNAFVGEATLDNILPQIIQSYCKYFSIAIPKKVTEFLLATGPQEIN